MSQRRWLATAVIFRPSDMLPLEITLLLNAGEQIKSMKYGKPLSEDVS